MNRILNSDTLMPISAFALIAGGVFWLSSVFSTVQANSAAIQEVKEAIKDTDFNRAEYRRRLWESLHAQDKRLAVIEGKLDVIAEIVTKQLEAERSEGRVRKDRQP